MKIVLEKPITWLKSDRDGERNKLMYTNLSLALKSIGSDVTEMDTFYGSDFSERHAPPGGALISYHSVGGRPNVWRLKETSIPFYYNLDKLGYSGWSELSVNKKIHEGAIVNRNQNHAESFCRAVSSWLIEENLSKYVQGSRYINEIEPFVLFPMQVRDDIVAVHNRLDPLRVLRVAAAMCKKHKRLLLVKRHPYCKNWKTASLLGLLDASNKYVRITDASITSLLPVCQAVLVGNSGVGLEAIIYGKPVYSFAKSEYDFASYQIESEEDIESVYFSSSKPHPNGFKFGHYFLSERCFDARDIIDIKNKIQNLIISEFVRA